MTLVFNQKLIKNAPYLSSSCCSLQEETKAADAFVTFNNQKFKIFWLILKSKEENFKIHINSYFCCRLYLLVLESLVRWEETRQEKGLLISTMRPSIFASEHFTASPRSEILLWSIQQDSQPWQILICIAFTVAITYRRLVTARCLLIVHD